MVFATAYFEDVQRSEHVLECLAEIATSVVVQREIGIAVCGIRVVIAQYSLLQYNALSLKLNRLKVVAHFELDACQLSDRGCHVFVHGSCNLKERVDALGVEFKRLIEHTFLEGGFGPAQHVPDVVVLKV